MLNGDAFVISLPLLLLSAFVVFGAGTIQGATGFGFVIVAAPVVTIYIAPSLAVPVLVINGVVLTAVLLSRVYRDTQPRRVAVLTLFGVVSVPLGTLLLVTLDGSVIKILLGIVVGITAIAMLTGLQRTAKNEQVASVPVGIASGILTGSTGIAGAPVILFCANQQIDPRRFRANITVYLVVVNAAALPSFLVAGVLTGQALALAAALIPASVAGLFTGIWLARRISTITFRRLSLIVVLIAAGGVIATGAAGA